MRDLLAGRRIGHKWLAAFGVAGVVLVALAFQLRADFVDTKNSQLCNVLYTLIARSGETTGKPGAPGYAYYQEHPEELAIARQQNMEFLDALPCDP